MQTGNELISCSIEQKKELWEKEQLQKFADSGKEPKNDSWKNKYKGVAQIDSVTHEVPDNWGWASAEAICASVRDGTHDTPKYVEEGIPLITSKNLINGKLNYSKIQMISENDHKEISKRSGVDDGDILYAMIGTIGNPVVVKKTSEFSIKNVGLFKKNEDFIKPNYLKYWLDSPQFNNWLKPRLKGTTQKFAPLGLLRSLPVPIAPPEQQKRIVAKIEELFSHIDAGIDALKKAKKLLKQYRQSVLKAAVTGELTKEWREENKAKLEPASQLLERILKERRQKWEQQQLEQFKAKGKMPKDDKWKGKYKEPKSAALLVDMVNPNEWELVSIDQVAEVFLGKMLDKSKHTAGEKLPYLRNINVRWGNVDVNDVSEMFFKEVELNRYNLISGDVLVCEGGEPGRAAVWYDDIPNMKYQKALHRVRFYLPLSPEYLSLLLEYFASTGLLSRYFTGSTIKHFTKESFISLPFPLPCLDEMKKIVGYVEEKITSIQRIESDIELQLLKVDKEKQSILASAFKGELHETK